MPPLLRAAQPCLLTRHLPFRRDGHGQIESGRYEGLDNLYCRYTFSHGDDWQVARGVEEGVTQMSTASGSTSDAGQLAVWNFPVDVTFRATGAYGWPQIVLSVYGTDAFGRADMIVGYGAAHLPMAPGRHEIYIRTFRPLASSLYQRLMSWLLGQRAELRLAIPQQGEGRDAARSRSAASRSSWT